MPSPGAPLRRSELCPVAKHAVKGIRIGVLQRRCDLLYRKLGVVEKLPGQLKSRLTDELPQVLAVFPKASPQGPLADSGKARMPRGLRRTIPPMAARPIRALSARGISAMQGHHFCNHHLRSHARCWDSSSMSGIT